MNILFYNKLNEENPIILKINEYFASIHKNIYTFTSAKKIPKKLTSFKNIEKNNYDIVFTIFINPIFLKKYEKKNKLIVTSLNFFKNPILYVVRETQIFTNCGYCSRTNHLLKNQNNFIEVLNPIICKSKCSKYNNVYFKDGHNIVIKNTSYIEKIISFLNIKKIIMPSNGVNFNSFYEHFKTNQKLNFTYEVRGYWFLSGQANGIKNSSQLREKGYEIQALKNAKNAIFITDEAKNYAITNLGYNNNKKSLTLPNCYDTLNPIKILNKTRNNNSELVIGYFGSMCKYEWIEGLISAIKELNNIGYKIKLMLIGNIKCNLNINENFIEHYKWVEKDVLIKCYEKIDLFVLPRYPYQVCEIISPLKPFDPLFLKIPLLMSSCDCLKSISENGKNCMLFQKGNKNDLKNKIIQIYKNGYPKKLLNNGHNFIINDRNWINHKKRLYIFINSLN